MLKRILTLLMVLAAPLTLLGSCAALQSDFALPRQHPPEAELGGRNPVCTDCHEPRGDYLAYERFNHTAFFAGNHRQEAYQNERLCAMCHQEGFCNTCHATQVELKPSIRNQTDNFRRMPHRGDYLSRHRIDGRIDPTSCFRCHGSPKTAKTCVTCHG